jgi:hypothetical protein
VCVIHLSTLSPDRDDRLLLRSSRKSRIADAAFSKGNAKPDGTTKKAGQTPAAAIRGTFASSAILDSAVQAKTHLI